ncbi:MAG: MoxR family ATPase, partial [Bacteroidota bacterium]
IKHVYKIRELKLRKPPSTAELIYWVLLLQKMNFDFSKIDKPLSFDERRLLLTSYSVLAKNKDDLEILDNL